MSCGGIALCFHPPIVDNFLVTTSLTLLNLLILLAERVFESVKRDEACKETGKLNFRFGELLDLDDDRECTLEWNDEGVKKLLLLLILDSEVFWHDDLLIAGVVSNVTSSKGVDTVPILVLQNLSYLKT